MSRRNRRQQEELEALAANADVAGRMSDEDDEESRIALAGPSKSAFAALSAGLGAEGIDDDDEEDNDEQGQTQKKKRKPKKKKKKQTPDSVTIDDQKGTSGTATPVKPAAQALASSKVATKNTPNKQGRSKSKAKVEARDEDAGLDEIDRALKELGVDSYSKNSENASSQSHLIPITNSKIRSLLAVEPKNLDADAELKRFFGSKVVASAAVKPQLRGARAQNPHHAMYKQFSRGGMLAKPQQNWPPAAFAKSGLEMELVESGSGETLWTFQHSRAYIEVTHMYLEAVASMDPNQLMALLHVHPYHVETLLGLSDMAAQQGDPGMSQDFLDRALYAYERAFAPNFNIQNGNARLDFRRIESRGFFRAMEKRINSLMKRGTWRTLHEHAKFLYAISPFDDPYGALLFLDFTAPKAKQYTWFIDFLNELPATIEKAGHESHLELDTYPGLWYAQALSQWHIEEAEKGAHDKSTKYLKKAILRYPLTCHILIRQLGSSIPPAFSALEHSQPDPGFSKNPSYILQLLSALYVHRSETLWREPEVLEWLQQTTRETVPSFTSQADHPDVLFGKSLWKTSRYPQGAVPEGILRHVLVADIQNLRLYLPQRVLNSVANSYDPLPPGPGFDDDYFRPMYEGGSTRSRQAIPGGRGAEGLLGRLMQFMGDGGDHDGMDPEMQAAIMEQLQQYAAEARGAGPPGTFPGANGANSSRSDDDEDDGHDDDQDESEAVTQSQSQGGFFNYLRGMLGRQSAQEGSGNGSEEDVSSGDEAER